MNPAPETVKARFLWPGPAGQGLRASGPARCVRLTDQAPEALSSLPALVAQWMREGVRLVTGALTYEAGAAGAGPHCAHPVSGPKAVLLGFTDYQRFHKPARSEDWALTRGFEPGQGRAAYEARVRRIQAYLLAGDCYQVNLAQRFQAQYRGDPLQGWLRLYNHHPAPFAGYLDWPGGALLSASPERFIQVRGRQIVTEPIKGSRPRSSDTGEDRRLGEALLGSEKDRAENLMIVDLLRNDLGKVCKPGSIEVPELFGLRRFSNVQHLVSTVTGQLRDRVTPLEALLACFPGGSITGAPKRRAMEIIRELEPVPRDFYCGTLFYLTDQGELDSSILIRTIQAQADGTLLCHGGGGVVADSNPAREYEESLFKIQALMDALR